MFLKQITIIFVTIIFSINLIGNEMETETFEPTDACEAAYSVCLDTCEASDDKEQCFDKCDEAYDKCLTKAQSN